MYCVIFFLSMLSVELYKIKYVYVYYALDKYFSIKDLVWHFFGQHGNLKFADSSTFLYFVVFS